MNTWINPDALWKIVVVGILAGAGLPALFAVGVRALNPPVPPAGARGYTVAVGCFAVVLAAIGWGISLIVGHS
ncbi:hypothetical protein [Kitasatospora brasiliensis]|uniref:hypothetical protein n=1 Tax=Kitasatospora brasiliensis TaxID=3058040 RepID=UPI002930468C|nr:hypothetical protein [Kitasatospora sp. K002]